MSRPVVVVLGAAADDPPPGIDPAAELADLRYAPDGDALRASIGDAEGLFSWGAKRAWIEDAFDRAARL
ncbi:MAG: D-2-hydroxyacid dehydrogenase, partial [Actinomycetota bacterium]|nr:D-2-hydroxyacid dehydrogenase [Actinomycetota bacterium]